MDTGAGASLIKLKNLKDTLKVDDNDLIMLKGINEFRIPTLGRCKIELNFKNEIIYHEFLIVKNDFPISTDGILGFDFLLKNNASINCVNGECEISISRGKFILSPRSETIIPIRIINNLDSGIVPKTELLPQVFTSETLINSKFPVISIINTRESQVEIEKPSMILENFDEAEVVPILHIKPTKIGDRTKLLEDKLRLDHLNQIEKDEILKICKNFNDLFFLDTDYLGTTNATCHKIPLTDNKPIYVKPYRIPECHKEEINRQITDMEKQGIIQKSTSPWNAPLLVVPKKMDASGKKKWRVVVDFRKLNNVTIGDAFPLPNITDILDQLGNSKYFTTLDLASGFHQVPIDPKDAPKTAFSTIFGHYEFTRMPFGLKGAPATFQRLMNSVLTGLQGIRCFVYLDDVVVYGNSLEDHNNKLIDVLKRLRQHSLKLHPDKCEFLRKEVQYLGHVITENGIKPDERKTLAVENFPIPKNLKEIKSFLGLAGYYRKFIKKFSDIVSPITKLLKKDQDFKWGEEQQNAFDSLKTSLTTAPVLQYPDFRKKFILTTDASGTALGAILSQGELGQDRPIAFASRMLNKCELNYSTIEKELLAIVWGVQHYRPYLYGREFTIYTDHRPLKWLNNNKDLSSRLLRWRLKLEEYSYQIEYIKGKSNTSADALSRINHEEILLVNYLNNYTDFLEYSKSHIINNPNIIDKNNSKCKFKVQFSDNPEYSSKIVEQNNESIFISINSFENPNYEEVFESLKTLKELLISKNNKEFVFLKNNNLNWQTIRTMLRFIFKNTEIKCYLSKEKITPSEKDIPNILYEFHNTPVGGHNGFSRTIRKIKSVYIWDNMTKEIKEYVKNCHSCQINKLTRKKTKVPMEITTTSKQPFEKIFMDIVGPLTLTEDGNKYILTIQDDLSKFSLAIPISSTDTETIANHFVEHFITKFGMPQCILTDQGSNFTSDLFKNLCKLFKIKKINTTAYHPQSNGALERSHQTFKDYLKHFTKPTQTDWDKWIHLSTFSYNTTNHTSSNYTPFELVFGNEAKTPSSLKSDPKFSYSIDDYIDNLKTKLQVSWKHANENLINSKNKSKTFYDQKLIKPSFKVGDKVLLLNEKSSKGLSKKLCPSYTGPYEILELKGVNVIIKIRNKSTTVHVNKLKPFHSS